MELNLAYPVCKLCGKGVLLPFFYKDIANVYFCSNCGVRFTGLESEPVDEDGHPVFLQRAIYLESANSDGGTMPREGMNGEVVGVAKAKVGEGSGEGVTNGAEVTSGAVNEMEEDDDLEDVFEIVVDEEEGDEGVVEGVREGGGEGEGVPAGNESDKASTSVDVGVEGEVEKAVEKVEESTSMGGDGEGGGKKPKKAGKKMKKKKGEDGADSESPEDLEAYETILAKYISEDTDE